MPNPRTKRLRFFNVDNSNLRRARNSLMFTNSYYTKGSGIGRAAQTVDCKTPLCE